MDQDFPARIGDYTPERLVGRGAMAGVYLCHGADGEPLALKWMDRPHPPLVRRFELEVAALQRLDHPGIVSHRDHGVHEGRPYLVMEYIDGSDLRAYAKKLHERPPVERYQRCRTIGRALCEVLDYLHLQGLVHRDVKPSNVLIGSGGRVVLTDFGVVKDLGAEDRTAVGLMVGTMAYAAPEQVEGERIGPRADLFGLGATLYHLLTLRRPFEGLRRVGSSRPPPPSTIDPDIPAGLDSAVMRLLAHAPRDRFSDAREAAEALTAQENEGMLIAGRQGALGAVAIALEAAATGQPVWLRPIGPRGSGQGWLTELVRRGAGRRGIRVYEAESPAATVEPMAMLRRGEVLLLLCPLDLDVPLGVMCVELPLDPLGVADIRRTVVAAAPLTPDPAQVAARLLDLTGGMPGLLLPLMQRHSEGQILCLPDDITTPTVVEDYFEGLDIDEREVLGVLSLLDVPVDPTLIEAVALVPTDEPLAVLAERGLAREIGGRWMMGSELFRSAARELVVDPEGTQERLDGAWASRTKAPAGEGLRGMIDTAEVDRLAGRLAESLDKAERVAGMAQAVGDRGLECEGRVALGRVLLDLGRPRDARRALADASALSRAAERPRARRASHVLRARADLAERPGDRMGAAAAIDRLMDQAVGAASRDDDDPVDISIYATWAWAAAVLGDRRTLRRTVRDTEQRLAVVAPELRVDALLCLARASAARGDRDVCRERATAALAEAGPLHQWEARRLLAAIAGEPSPPADSLGDGLSESARADLEARWVYVR